MLEARSSVHSSALTAARKSFSFEKLMLEDIKTLSALDASHPRVLPSVHFETWGIEIIIKCNKKMLASLPGSLLIESIVARRLLLLFLLVLTTLHRRVHLKHFELLLYICSLTDPKDNLPTALEHRINCFANEKRHRSLRRRLWLLCCRLGMILCFLHFHNIAKG